MAGFGLIEGLQFAKGITDIKKQRKADAFEKEYDTHLAGLQQDPEYKPRGAYNPRAFEQARMARLDTDLKDQRFRQGVFEQQKNDITMQYNEAMQYHRQATAAREAGDMRSEVAAIESAYENVFDGYDIEFGKDGKSYTLKHKLTGEEDKVPFDSHEEMMDSLRSTMDNLAVERNFAQKAIQARIENARINANQRWTSLVDADGKQIGYTTTNYNNKTGKVDRRYQIQGKDISAEEARQRNLIPLEDFKTLAEGRYKMRAGEAAVIGAKSARERAAAVAKDKGIKPQSPEGKFAFDIMNNPALKKLFPDDAAIFDFALKIAQSKSEGALFKSVLQTGLVDAGTPEMETIMEAAKQLIPALPQGARGLPKQTKAPTGALGNLEKKYPASGLKEGQTAGGGKYVVRNGKWTQAK